MGFMICQRPRLTQPIWDLRTRLYLYVRREREIGEMVKKKDASNQVAH